MGVKGLEYVAVFMTCFFLKPTRDAPDDGACDYRFS